MLTRLLNSKGTQLTHFQKVHLIIHVFLTWLWFPNAIYLWITFGLASLFTLDIVVDYLVKPRVCRHICFYQRHLKTTVPQSLDLQACMHCDSPASHLSPLLSGKPQKSALYSDTFPFTITFPSFCRVGMDRTSRLQRPSPCQAALYQKKKKKQSVWEIHLLMYLITVCNQPFLLSRNITSE